MQGWDGPFEKECHRLVVEVCDATLPAARRDAAWRELLVRVAPHVEAWAAASPVQRRVGLATPDDVRAVLVGVLSRMSARSFENLRGYLARQRPAPEDDEEEAALVEGLVRLAGGDEGPAGAEASHGKGDAAGTPLRGWLLSLTRYAIKDHVKQRLGWTSSVRARYGVERGRRGAERAELERAVRAVAGVLGAELDERALELEVEYLPGTARPERIDAAVEAAGFRVTAAPDLRRSKRDLVTGAERIDAITEPGARPPITDAITVRRLLGEASAYLETFPAPMGEAVRRWLDDEPFDEIAEGLGLEGPERARALVRAGTARLRERFRGRFPAMLEV